MEEDNISQFEIFEKKNIVRRKLLPVWIKIFCWLFMIMGICSIGCLIAGAFGLSAGLSLYGFETQQPFSIVGFFIIGLILFKGFCAYLLWFEKNNAINICKADAILGVILCVVSMFVLPIINENSHVSYRLEIALLIPYYIKLNKIEYEWDNLEKL
jgi:hypothetical protein